MTHERLPRSNSIKHVFINWSLLLFNSFRTICTYWGNLLNDFLAFLEACFEYIQEYLWVLTLSQLKAEWLDAPFLKIVVNPVIVPYLIIQLALRDVIEQGRIKIEILESLNHFWESGEGLFEVVLQGLTRIIWVLYIMYLLFLGDCFIFYCSLNNFLHCMRNSWWKRACESICFCKQ